MESPMEQALIPLHGAFFCHAAGVMTAASIL